MVPSQKNTEHGIRFGGLIGAVGGEHVGDPPPDQRQSGGGQRVRGTRRLGGGSGQAVGLERREVLWCIRPGVGSSEKDDGPDAPEG